MAKPTTFQFGLETPVERPTVQARLKLWINGPDAVIYKAVCQSAHGCRQYLGWVSWFESEGAWAIRHEDGYYGFHDTGYRIWDPDTGHDIRGPHYQPERGRRPNTYPVHPEILRKYPSAKPAPVNTGSPVLPAKIFCRCGTPNWVVAPEV